MYDPDSIAAYWGKRPRAVVTRIVQLMSVAGGFLSGLAWDLINNKIKEVRFSTIVLPCISSMHLVYFKLTNINLSKILELFLS